MLSIDKTPQQIMAEKKKIHDDLKSIDLRAKIRLEYEFLKLSMDEIEKIRWLVLKALGYNPELKMRQQDWDVRLIYHADHEKLARNAKVMSFYAQYREQK